MRSRSLFVAVVASTLACSLSACSSAPEADPTDTQGSAETWNYGNDPNRLGPLEMTLASLPVTGKSDKVAWSETYWPRRDDSFNVRWQGSSQLSPLEKYDAAFNGWKPTPEFMKLRPLTTASCAAGKWDAEYYEKLGPAAKYWTNMFGNGSARQAVRPGAYACGALENIPDWEGSCHAWTPAAMIEEEPQGPVVINGVRFEVSDIKALVTMIYFYSQQTVLGERCSQTHLERDANGRIREGWCRDTNAGSFHAAIANVIGKQKRPLGEDRVATDQVWNQPVVGYNVKTLREVPQDEALRILGAPSGAYTFNANAKRFAYVETTLDYITEREPSTQPSTPIIDQFVRHDNYAYVLELDLNGKIIGGEWAPGSQPPDFLWHISGPGRMSNPEASRWNIVKLLRASRPTAVEGRAKLYESNPQKTMPDFGTVTSTIRIADTRPAGKVTVLVDVAHNNISGLTVTLEKNGRRVATLFDRDKATFGYEDLSRKYEVDLTGTGTLEGDYTLRVQDSDWRSYGKFSNWGIAVE